MTGFSAGKPASSFLCLIVADRWPTAQCTKRLIRCPGGLACEVRSTIIVLVCMTSDITLLVRRWCRGTAPVRMWIDVYLFCQRTSDTLASPVPTGIYRSVRS